MWTLYPWLMVTTSRELDEEFVHSDLPVLYDVFAMAVAALAGAYAAAERRAQSPAEAQLWLGRLEVLGQFRTAVSPHDRDGLLRAIATLRADCATLAASTAA